jgi:hypothetical protein
MRSRALLLCFVAVRVLGGQAIRAMPAFQAGQQIAGDATLAFTIEGDSAQPIRPITIVVGSLDLGAFVSRDGRRLTLGRRPIRLPSGQQDVVVYEVNGTEWREIGRASVQVLMRGGFEKARAAPALTLNNAGQLTERASEGQPDPQRPSFQDFTGSAGLELGFVKSATSLESRWNLVGASRREQALRFGTRQNEAPKVDLSDFVVRLTKGPANLAFGHVTMGTSRHLVNNLASRGVTTTLTRGPASLSFGVVNGASIVGWDNLLGIDNSRHQMRSATLGVELVPRHPGGLKLEVAALDGSTQPNAGFTRGAILDAETSDGTSVQLSAATPGQRIRLTSGYTTSRFDLAKDPQLTGDTILTPVRPDRRGARFGELTLGLIQGLKLSKDKQLSLTTNLRHERIDPLYRSIGAQLQADRDQSSGDLQLLAGPLSLQIAHARSGDNLDHIPSVLRTVQRTSTAALSVPLAQLVSAQKSARWWPMLSWSMNQVHALANDLPVNGSFRPVDLPDQVSTNNDIGAQWSLGTWRLGYRHNRSNQDNRQSGREKADFSTSVDALSVGVAARATLDVALDGSLERQENVELSQTNRLTRVGTIVNWRLPTRTGFSSAIAVVRSRDEPRTARNTTGDVRFELSQGVGGGAAGGAERGRLFLRYARQSQHTIPMIAPPPGALGRAERWSVASGFSVRVF